MPTDIEITIIQNALLTAVEEAEKREGRLREIVSRTASMGWCSQTHHEHLAADARAALADKQEAGT